MSSPPFDSSSAASAALGGLALGDPPEPPLGESLLGIAASSMGGDTVLPPAPVVQSPVEFGQGFALVRNTDLLCMACVGSSDTKFCVQTKQECEVKLHKGDGNQKVNVNPGLFICVAGSRGGFACLTNPSVAADKLSEPVIADILSRSFSAEEARNHIAMLNSQMVKSVEDQLEYETVWNTASTSFKTPSKSKKPVNMYLEASDYSNKWQSVLDVMALGKSTEVAPEDLPAVDSLAELIYRSMSNVDDLKSYLTDQAEDLDHTLTDIDEHASILDSVAIQVKRLEVSIGRPGILSQGRKLEPVIWDALASLSSEVESLQGAVQHKENKMNVNLAGIETSLNNHVKKVAIAAEERVKGVERVVEKKEKDTLGILQEILNSYRNRIDSLTKQVNQLKVDLTAQSQIIANKPVTSNSTLPVSSPPAVSAAASMLGSLGIASSAAGGNLVPPTSFGIGGDPNASTNSGSNPSSTNGPALNPTVLASITARLEELEAHNEARESQGLESAIRICNHTFTNDEDVEAYMTNNGPSSHGVPRFGLFVDPLILYHWIWSRLAGNSNSSTELTTRKKLDIQELELRALESFGADVPFVFAGTSSTMSIVTPGPDKSRLANLKTFKDWENAGLATGLRYRVEAQALMIKESLLRMIDKEYMAYPVISALAKDMLTTSYTFIIDLHSYMSETYTNFKAMGVGSEKEIWGLVTFVVEQLFKTDFAKKRLTAIGTLDVNHRDSGFQAMWCAMKSVGLAKHLATIGIKDTPSVSASYVRFVLSQSNMGQIGTLLEENTSLKRKLETTNQELTDVKRIATEAKKLADSAISKANAAARNVAGAGRGGGRGAGRGE